MNDERILVGFDGSDDAAVYKLTDELAIINTLDFFTPMDDDPYVFGQIAAANSLSDVYAMGGEPLIALNIVCFPCSLSMEVLGEILRGGADKVLESGAVVAGGHSVDDPEPKYGLSVTGVVHPDKVWRNTGAQIGDVLILTKPIGTGIMNTAMKGALLSEEQRGELILSMSTLNKYAAEAVKVSGASVNACTDITGFGLLGHLLEMAGGDVTAEISASKVPLLTGVQEMIRMGIIPAGAYKNMDYVKPRIRVDDGAEIYALCDPQTSGGLVFAVPERDADKAMEKLSHISVFAPHIIGRVIEKTEDTGIIVKK